ncbi:hypothetical protein GCT13_41020 [Paraburkholderia sp. CNPSo 3157]|uniref:Uncharacterized protein n=1 Tax=Paraburkholderia franconis TaxID=2654983 RepID=A0A7X1NJ89_9BURK|nr:hypothetical protein [Paraburkholderia franconis]MPW22997.1 hypothetical protein [Paraburkholderia franconis]
MWDSIQYDGFEINVMPILINHAFGTPVGPNGRFRFSGYVCRPGVDLRHGYLTRAFQSLEFDLYESEAQAREAGYEMGRSIVDGRHPTISVDDLQRA